MDRIDVDTVLRVFADKEKFPNIPTDLIEHAKLCFQRENYNRLTHALLSEGAEEVLTAIDQMFARASEITGLPPRELLKRTDFNYRDTDPIRIDAAFAEIRTVNFLGSQGFVDIEPLQSTKGKKKADIVARRGNEKYAIEVANSIYEAKRRIMIPQLKDWLLSRYYGDHKNEQLKITALELGCQRRVFIAVINTEHIVIFRERKYFCEAAKLTWEEAERDPEFHICLVTGKSSPDGPDDCVFPEWP